MWMWLLKMPILPSFYKRNEFQYILFSTSTSFKEMLILPACIRYSLTYLLWKSYFKYLWVKGGFTLPLIEFLGLGPVYLTSDGEQTVGYLWI